MNFVLLKIAIVCLFGSLCYLFPTQIWSDFTFLFRKENEYLEFSNRMRGRYLFFMGILAAILFALSDLFFQIISESQLIWIFFVLLFIFRVFFEIKWILYKKNNLL